MKVIKLLFLAIVASSVLTSCSDDDMPILKSIEIAYPFHDGQVVATAPYAGLHSNDLSASMKLEELENGNTLISITINNTISGETYRIHAHDAADASSTPNGTPYIEAPNANILAQMAEGTGSSLTITQEATMSYNDLTSSYEGFFVIHDPLQNVNTADISTFLIVGAFAKQQTSTSYKSSNFNYDFNTGQVASAFAYTGSHDNTLSANIQVDELANDQSRVSIRIMNTLSNQIYHTHAHDMADSATTPNGTPYNESPNGDVFVAPIAGTGGLAGAVNISPLSYDEITMNYDGFFVIHDPLQTITTIDPTTYVILGVFAR